MIWGKILWLNTITQPYYLAIIFYLNIKNVLFFKRGKGSCELNKTKNYSAWLSTMNLSLLVIISSNSFLKAAWLWINSQSSSDSRYLFLRHHRTTFSHWSENRATRAGQLNENPPMMWHRSAHVLCCVALDPEPESGAAGGQDAAAAGADAAGERGGRHERRSEPTASPTRRASRAENPSSPGGDARVQPAFSCVFHWDFGNRRE